MTYIDVITEQVKTYCQKLVDESLYLKSFDPDRLLVVDDENPEGGVLVNAVFSLETKFDGWANPPQGIELVKAAHLAFKGKMQFWTTHPPRSWRVNGNKDGTLTLAFYYLPTLTIEEYGAVALRVWKAAVNTPGEVATLWHEDDVLQVRYDGRYLETQRVSNMNPTTMIKFDGKETLGECIRHHGEHCYLVKRLLQLDPENQA